MKLTNKTYIVPKHKFPVIKEDNSLYTIKRNTDKGEVIEIKPEVLELIRKRLEAGEDIRN